MKNNQPVTNVEYVLKETDSIVSKTDLKGIITYINEDFLRISGFEEDELIGASHNIVRHPDMPVEAFADLWDALKANRPWTGFVKNRCKNGHYYWVLANATPIYENGECIGYMSVRSKPSAQQISEASAVYALFQNGQSGSLRIQDGKVVKPGLIGKVNLMKKSSMQARLIILLAAMALMMISIGIVGLLGMSRSNDSLHVVYEDRVVPMEQISTIQKLILLNRVSIAAAIANPDSPILPGNTSEEEERSNQVGKLLDNYASGNLGAEERKLADQFVSDRKRYLQEGVQPAIAALRANDIKLANKLLLENIRPLYTSVEHDIEQLMRLQSEGVEHEYKISTTRYNSIHWQAVSMIVVGLMLTLWAVWTICRRVVGPVNMAAELLQKVAQGKYDNDITVAHRDEVCRLIDTVKAMQITLGFKMADEGRIASENLRIRIGLDNVSTGVTIADTDRTIIYMNKAALDLMHEVENDFRKDLPNFDAAKLKGGSIDIFHKNPEHQKRLLEGLSNTYRTKIEIGGRTFALAASPVINKNGIRLGTAMEWNDRTVEVAMEKEIADIVAASVRGDFSKRIDLVHAEGFFKQLGTGVNQLVETLEHSLQELERMLDSLAKGDLTDRITNEYSGTFGQLKDDANATSDQLKNIINQIKNATDTINTAAKEIASGNMDLSQRTERQSASLEETAAGMEELTATVRNNAENAKQANQLANNASAVAQKGGAVVENVVKTMGEINESSRKIVDIISVIDGIAFQTNILALNAAVEAARAGEQGRGFAVVAAEVRNLAQRSATAAKEIKQLIGDSVDKVEGGGKLVAQAGQTMQEIVIAVKHVTDIMSEISAASTEQSLGIQQVNTAIAQMDQVTQQNAALVEEAAASAESMEEEAQNLTQAVSVFKLAERQQSRAIADPVAKRVVAKPVSKPSSAAVKKLVTSNPKTLPAKSAKADEEWEEF